MSNVTIQHKLRWTHLWPEEQRNNSIQGSTLNCISKTKQVFFANHTVGKGGNDKTNHSSSFPRISFGNLNIFDFLKNTTTKEKRSYRYEISVSFRLHFNVSHRFMSTFHVIHSAFCSLCFVVPSEMFKIFFFVVLVFKPMIRFPQNLFGNKAYLHAIIFNQKNV